MEWKSIETAPKDGTLVLLLGKDQRHADGYWQGRTPFTGNGHWVWPYVNREPTHWMPLPPPPKERA